MEKVYLLLRQNIQSGPFTLDELARLQLQPSDLIWIEGESKSWSGPAILTDEPRNDFRGPDTNDWIAPRGDEGRRTPEQRGSQASLAMEGTPVPTSSLSGSYRKPEDIELIFHKKGGPTVSLVQLLGVAAITAMLALAWDNRFKLLQTQKDSISYASTPVVFSPRVPEPFPPQSAANVIAQDSINDWADQPGNEVRNAAKSKKGNLKESTAKIKRAVVGRPAPNEAGEPEINELPPVTDVAATETTIADTPVARTAQSVDAGEQTKKKTLGQAIKGLFKKKNREARKREEKPEQ